jgi:hypothetical protein
MAVFVLAASQARADLSVDNIGLFGGANQAINSANTIVEIQMTGSSGVWVYADAQTASNFKFPDGSPMPLYCIDLSHDNYLGSSYQLTPWNNPNHYSAQVLNRIAWAVESTPASGYAPAATQLLIWSLVDPKFEVINWNGALALEASYQADLARMSSEYNPQVHYHCNLADAVHAPQSYMNQDLAWPNPEPSSMLIAVAGAMGMIAYGIRMRWRVKERHVGGGCAKIGNTVVCNPPVT